MSGNWKWDRHSRAVARSKQLNIPKKICKSVKGLSYSLTLYRVTSYIKSDTFHPPGLRAESEEGCEVG